jgi:RNA polymerase sigma-70 factor (ECF subfamily)
MIPLCPKKTNHSTSFNWLYTKYWKQMLDVANIYLKDYSLAEEIVQELFIDFYQKRTDLTQIENISSYLKKSIKNRVYNYLLKNKNQKEHLKKLFLKTEKESYNPVHEEMDMRDKQKEISFYLSQLAEPCRTVFLLNREKQLTIKQIAIKLQRPEDTVTKQLSRAVKYLRKRVYDTENHAV